MISVRGLYYPEPLGTTPSNVAVNNTTGIFGNIVSIPLTGNVTHIGYRHGGNAAATNNIRIETLDSNGDPSGTLYDPDAYSNGNTVATGWNEFALNDVVAVTSGDNVAVTMQNTSAGNMQYQRQITGINTNFPYTTVWDGANWTRNTAAPVIGFKYDDGLYHYIPGIYPVSSIVSQSFNSGSVLKERGVKFNFPFNCEIEGAWYPSGNFTGELEIRLYQGSTLIYSRVVPPNNSVLNSTATRLIPFETMQSITRDTNYYLSVLATDGTNTRALHFTYGSAAQLNAFSGGTRFTSVRRASPAANWFEYSDERIIMGVIISAIAESESGGGGIDSYGYSA
jgi:hypothetical protein